MTTNKRYVQLLAMAQTGKKLESWATDEDKKIYQEMIEADKTMRRSAKELGIKNPILEILLEIDKRLLEKSFLKLKKRKNIVNTTIK